MATVDTNPIIFPLDVPSLAQAREWVRRLRGEVGVFKVGYELFMAAGPDAVKAALDEGAGSVFLDAKLHDIPATVEGGARAACDAGVRMLTAHCQGGPQMLAAAVRGAGDGVCVLGVTRLTSLEASPSEVIAAAKLAREAGCGGVVCSGLEAAAVRDTVGPDLTIVCPGVRPRGSDVGDQVRVVTPAEAIAAGADYVVIGRPIRNATDPVGAARSICEQIDREVEA